MNLKILKRYSFFKRQAQSLMLHKALVPPKRVEINLTNSCNLRCAMCDRWKWPKECKRDEEILNGGVLSKLFHELKQMGVKHILLTGGEPTLRKDFCSIITKLSELNFQKISVITNGTNIDNENSQLLAASNATIIFSLDGVADTHDKIRGVNGTFEKAIRALKKIDQIRNEKNYHCRIEINYTLQKDNIFDVVPLFQIARKNGANAINFNVVHGHPSLSLNNADILKIKRNFNILAFLTIFSKTKINIGGMLRAFIENKIQTNDMTDGLPARSLFESNPVPCLVAYHRSFIDGFGNVFPCCYCHLGILPYGIHENKRSKYSLGNILEKSFSEIWYGDAYNNFRLQTDPVNMKTHYLSCGQCYDYFVFKKYARFFTLLKSIKIF